MTSVRFEVDVHAAGTTPAGREMKGEQAAPLPVLSNSGDNVLIFARWKNKLSLFPVPGLVPEQVVTGRQRLDSIAATRYDTGKVSGNVVAKDYSIMNPMPPRREGYVNINYQAPAAVRKAILAEARRTGESMAALLTRIFVERYGIAASKLPRPKRTGRPPKD